MTVRVHINLKATRNPSSWRWKLGCWLLGKEFHAFNTYGIEPKELRVKLGKAGAHNTVEPWVPETYETWLAKHPGISDE
jgi:hypothetical protein